MKPSEALVPRSDDDDDCDANDDDEDDDDFSRCLHSSNDILEA
jgi:hypothetical protein